MSFVALTWAARQRPGNLAAKMILLGLANYADEHGHSYPSTAALASFGDMDHKTATAALDRLAALGLITDTGQRQGRTRQIKVYGLALSTPETEASQKRKPSVSSVKAPQKRGTDTIKEPVSQKTSSSSKSARAAPTPKITVPDWIPADAWEGWLAMRQASRKGGGKITPRGVQLAIEKLEKLKEDGHPPGDVLDQSTLNLWTSLYPIKDNRNDQRVASSGYSGGEYRPGPQTRANLAAVSAVDAEGWGLQRS